MWMLNVLLLIFWRDLQLSETNWEDEKKEGNLSNRAFSKIQFVHKLSSAVDDESGLYPEVSGMLGISQW